MRDPVIIRSNERWKAYSNQCFNLAAGLLAASVVKIIANPTYSVELVSWLAGTIALIWTGHGLLGLLEDEEI